MKKKESEREKVTNTGRESERQSGRALGRTKIKKIWSLGVLDTSCAHVKLQPRSCSIYAVALASAVCAAEWIHDYKCKDQPPLSAPGLGKTCEESGASLELSCLGILGISNLFCVFRMIRGFDCRCQVCCSP